MNGDRSLDEVGLLAQLGAIASAADGPPDLVYELGRAAFAWRRVDAELAELVADSALESSMVRSAAPQTRVLSFEAGDVTIEIQVTVRRGRRSLLGQVVGRPASSGGVVWAETDNGTAPSVPVDPVGRFAMDEVPEGRLRFRIEAPEATAVTTVWVDI
jgi:hypothetical protein